MKKDSIFPLIVIGFLLSAFIPWGCSSDKLPEPTLDFCDSLGLGALTYDVEVKAIIDSKCAIPGCHVTGFGSGDFSNYPNMLSRLESGSFRQRTIVLQDMPPAGIPDLTEEELNIIDCWLRNDFPEN